MAYYADCPVCQDDPTGIYTEGSPFTQEDPCAACGGTGKRRKTRDEIELALSGREWADECVREVFDDYCEVFGYHRAYGVESWDIRGDTLHIVQDTSARCCHNTETHTLPAEYLYTEGEERLALMRRDREAEVRAEEQEKARRKVERLASLEREAARLRSEIGESR